MTDSNTGAAAARLAQVRFIAAVITAALSTALTFWVLWGSLLRDGGAAALGSRVKDYGLVDQLTYMSVAKNVAESLPTLFVEPFSVTGESIVPSAYYWMLGAVARLAGSSVFLAWNTVGMAVTVLLSLAVVVWARFLAPSRLAWCVAPLALLVGTFQWIGTSGIDSWRSQYEAHAYLAPPVAALFNPGAEPFAMAWIVVGLTAAGAGYLRSGSGQFVLFGAAGLALGIAVLSHTYVSIFGIFALIVAVSVLAARTSPKPSRSLAVVLGALAASITIAASVPGASPLMRLGIVLVSAIATVGVRRRLWLTLLMPLATTLAVTVIVASPLLLRMLRQAGDPESFLSLRQQWATEVPLSLPPGPVFGQFAPTWALGTVAAVSLWRNSNDRRTDWWVSALVALLITSVVLTFNGWWGVAQEPYRYLPYGTVLITATALPWLWITLVQPSRATAAAAAIAALLLLTIPSVAAFAHTRPGNLVITPTERSNYETLAASFASDLVLYDRCFRNNLTKAVGGGRLVEMSKGFAIPPDLATTERLLNRVRSGQVPLQEDLASLGVRWIVSAPRCGGMRQSELRERFGAPLLIRAGVVYPWGIPIGPVFRAYKTGVSARQP